MEAPLLINGGSIERLKAENGDYAAVKSVSEAVSVFKEESGMLWKIAASLVFNIICTYATGSLTNIFAGHLGELELSAVSISMSVINTFSFGFLVCFLSFNYYFLARSFRFF
ncbi:hypothetical protein SOVF_183560 [Spinacia oleracea]|nr:hypothetical protein SOVF_183560 [Spinacia oleracea]